MAAMSATAVAAALLLALAAVVALPQGQLSPSALKAADTISNFASLEVGVGGTAACSANQSACAALQRSHSRNARSLSQTGPDASEAERMALAALREIDAHAQYYREMATPAPTQAPRVKETTIRPTKSPLLESVDRLTEDLASAEGKLFQLRNDRATNAVRAQTLRSLREEPRLPCLVGPPRRCRTTSRPWIAFLVSARAVTGEWRS
jgi:hypothetical protein